MFAALRRLLGRTTPAPTVYVVAESESFGAVDAKPAYHTHNIC